jgi:hypothetical protein
VGGGQGTNTTSRRRSFTYLYHEGGKQAPPIKINQKKGKNTQTQLLLAVVVSFWTTLPPDVLLISELLRVF